MSTIYFARNVSTLQKVKKKGKWLAVVDEMEIHLKRAYKGRVFTVSEIKKEMLDSLDGVFDIRVIRWLKQWADKPVIGKKSIKELLGYRGTSLWWFGESALYRESIGHCNSLRSVITRIDSIRFLFQNEQPKRVVVLSSNTLTGSCAISVSRSRGITPKIVGEKPDRSIDEFTPLAIYYLKKIRSLARIKNAKINRELYFSKKGPSQVMFLSYYELLRNSDDQRRKDVVLSPVIAGVDRRFGRSRLMYVDRKFPLGLASLRSLRHPACPTDLYSPMFTSWNCRKIWKNIKTSRQFKRSLRYKGIDIWPMVKDNFAFLFLKQYPEAVREIKTMERMLDTERPDVLFIHNETGFYGRALVIAAKQRDIKTIGIQHGSPGNLEIEYIHEWDGPKFQCPIPDYTAVWGMHDKATFTKSQPYNENNVIVTGSPKHDIFSKASEKYSREEFFFRFNIKRNKLVAITTQPFHIFKERKDWLTMVIPISNHFPDVEFIIKPHPAEDTGLHEEFVKNADNDNIRIIRNTDTYELLFCSDLSITAWSTTGLESLMLGTPLITATLSGQEESPPYSKRKASIGVKNREQLESAITQILNGQLPEDIKAGMQKFIEDYAYKVDGKASDRVVDILQKFKFGGVRKGL